MNKQATLKKTVMINAAVAVGVGLVFAGIYALVVGYAEESERKRVSAESALSADQSLITSLGNQIRNSGNAEKRFYEIQQKHHSPEFAANTGQMREWLRDAKRQYRFSQALTLTLGVEQATKENDLKGLDFIITSRPESKLELEAISDVHVFAFLDEVSMEAPGIVRLDKVTLKRKGEIDPVTVGQLQAGFTPFLVESEIVFSWIGVAAKDDVSPVIPTDGGAR